MKRNLLVVLGLLLSIFSYGIRYAYCDVKVSELSPKEGLLILVRIDQSADKVVALYDENEEGILFSSEVEALNYLGERGWKLVSTYLKTDFDHIERRHYLMMKELADGESAYDGLHYYVGWKDINLSEEEIEHCSHRDVNRYYVAWLIKTGNVDNNHSKEMNKYFPFAEEMKIVDSHTASELQSLGKKHDIYFEKYRKE